MTKSKSIPKEVKEQVTQIVEDYNQKNKTNFHISFKSKFAYLSKIEQQDDIANFFMQQLAKKMGVSLDVPKQNTSIETKLGRLTYNGQIDNWDFAVFRYSNEKYDPNEFMFPGFGELDGTIEGALNAGMQLYP